MNNELCIYPGELFIKNKTKYYGDFSTIIFSIKKKNINYLTIQNARYNQWARVNFSNFFKIFSNIL